MPPAVLSMESTPPPPAATATEASRFARVSRAPAGSSPAAEVMAVLGTRIEGIEAERGSVPFTEARRGVLASCALASALCGASLVVGVLEAHGACQIVHPLFWFPLAIASLGVAGSTYMTLSRTQ